MSDIKKVPASPKVRKFARELGVDINQISGSERKGRVTENDIKDLERNPLLNSLEKIEIDQGIKLNEPNRRGLNLLLDLQNRQITTPLLLKACLFRTESRGGHHRVDFPRTDENWKCHTRQQLGQPIKKKFIRN